MLPRNERQLAFTSSQAAGYLGVSLATIRRWTDAGHISCYRTPGGQRRFDREQLDAFVSSMYRNSRDEASGGGEQIKASQGEGTANGAGDHSGTRAA
jgi:excisionase family DNA binding protein